MPWNEVMHKFKHGELHSGSSGGPKVKDRGQAIAIYMSEKKKASQGKTEYQSKDKSKRAQKKKASGFASIPSNKGKS